MIGNFALWHTTFSTLWRRKWSSLLLTALVALGVMSSMILGNLTIRQMEGIEQLVRDTKINCVLTDPQGMHSTALSMPSAYVDHLIGNRHEKGCYLDLYVMDINAKATIIIQEPSGYELRRIYSFASDPKLSSLEGVKIELYDGWTEEILQSSEPVCLVPSTMELEPAEDGTVWVTLATVNKDERSLQVIGTITGGPENVIYSSFYFNWDPSVTEVFSVDSCSFTIQDNTRLEEAKEELYKVFAKPSLNNNGSTLEYGVLVQDELYLKSMEEMESNLHMLRLILPLLTVLGGCIGFFSSYLAIRGRMREFAVMRCLGMKGRKIFWLVFREQAILAILGALLGFGGVALIERLFHVQAFGKAVLMIVIFLIGSALASLRTTSINVMKLMKTED